MASVFDVAQYILKKQGPMSAMKLQKLVYYSQAWHTVWADKQLFKHSIEAWKDGPVCPALWRAHANQFRVSSMANGDAKKLDEREKRTIRQVLDFYGDKDAQWLSDLTHAEDPWLDARRGTRPGERSNAVITPKAMQRYYASL
ncbi:DUF4065 domain-containing protein [Erythrobacter sp. YJ-T3-07]|uniref:Panacea domain-containing protein n=1 Tax=Erythrobacter sp. YJ-T3-07 TaxID=2793063 RepID=UPI0018D43B47|nr:type II toxin-antitoxin system antitoxin SocA domain-containing protein [Erythrobacter sp. YJ-T3-07]MBH1943153.1 DUF4065 domain-containing protein [Erythrobacter sp. YJ-T3-07]